MSETTGANPLPYSRIHQVQPLRTSFDGSIFVGPSYLRGSITADSAIRRAIEKMPKPTRRQRLRWRLASVRERIGFWIAGHDPSDDGY